MSEERNKKVVRKKKNYKFRRFWKIYAIVVAVLLVGVVIINIKAWETMSDYEAAQPEYVLDNALADIIAGKIDVNMDANPFEDASEIAKTKFLESIEGKELTYMLDSKSYDAENPIYDVLINDQTVCKITLTGKNKRSKMAILTIYDWEVSKLEPVVSAGKEYAKITVPENFTVSINDVVLDKTYQVGDAKTLEGFEEAAKYVSVPQYVTYEVKGLYNKPNVKVTEPSGAEVALNDADVTNITVDYHTSDISDEIREMVLTNAKTFSNYFSRDVADCYNSINGIAYMFPEDSSYLVEADTYRREDMWMYSRHETPWFENESVTNYTSYSDDLFTVEVSFSKKMMLISTTGVALNQMRTDDVHQIFQYVRLNDKWVIADMRTVLD